MPTKRGGAEVGCEFGDRMAINRRDLLKRMLAAGAIGAAAPLVASRPVKATQFGYDRFTQPIFKPPVIPQYQGMTPAPGSPPWMNILRIG